MSIEYLGRVLGITRPDGKLAITNPTNSSISIGSISNISNLTLPKATDFLKNGVSSALVDLTKSTSAATKNLPQLVKNPMEDFASVNCLWTLACLEPQQFNNPASYRNNPSALQHVVFSSGGRFDSQRVNTFFGTPEYFVNNFQMNCIIGSTEKTGNSNAFKFTFDIIEPHSMGLLLQSMQNAAIKAGYLSYLDNTPYVLRMDIQGYDELGRVIKSVKPKFFVMKLVSMKFTVNEGGSNYKVEAIPYNHQGFADAINTSYTDLKISGDITGKGIVSEVLSTSKDSLVAVLNRNEEKLRQEGKIGIPDVYDIQFPKLSSDWYSSAGNITPDKKATVNPLATIATVIGGATSKPVDPATTPQNELGTASLGFDAKRGGNPLFKRAGDQIDSKTGIVKRDNMTIDPKARAFQFSQSQSLTAMINQVVLSSDYAKKALNPENMTPEGYIKWFKLDVQIELLEYDPVIGDYAKKITYRVVPFYIHQSIFANPSAAPVGYAELMKSVVKEYQYIYTGQNVDILKFDININNLFYTGTNPSPENEGAKTSNQDQNFSEKLNSTTSTGKGKAPESQGAQLGRSRPKRDPKLMEGYKGGSGTKTTEQNVAENFQRAFISGNSADMVTVDLEILGDPYWLVDSGIGNYFSGAASPSAQITNDGTMNYESGNVYIYLTFRTPADINEKTGLYDFSVSGKESAFGGIYRVNMCENYFQDGFWKQKLKCLRMPGPQGPEVDKTTSSSSTISKADSNATEIGKTEAPKSSPTDDTNSNTPVKNSSTDTTGSGSSSAANNGTSASANTKTNVTSNQPQRVAGFRYYRDIGKQN
jgi:hypothetical protein